VIKKRWLKDIFVIFFLCCLAFIAGGNNNRPDLQNYSQIWEMPNAFIEPGFVFTMSVLKPFVSFREFVLIYILVNYFLLSLCLKYLNVSKYFAFFYFIYPFIFDVIQLRYFGGQTLIICAFCFFLRKKYFFSFILVTLAITFHITFILFIPIFLILLAFEKKILTPGQIILFYPLLFFTLCLVRNDIFVLAAPFLPKIFYEKLLLYSTEIGYGGIIANSILLFNIGLVLYILHLKKSLCAQSDFFLFVYRLSAVFIILLPLLVVRLDFERYFRLLFIIYYIFYFKLFNYLKFENWVKLLFLAFFPYLVWVVFWVPGELIVRLLQFNDFCSFLY
jgi:hypothetical protein